MQFVQSCTRFPCAVASSLLPLFFCHAFYRSASLSPSRSSSEPLDLLLLSPSAEYIDCNHHNDDDTAWDDDDDGDDDMCIVIQIES